MKLKKTSDGLEIRNVPGCIWLLGLFFIAIGSVFLYGLLGGFSNYDQLKGWEIAVGLVITLAGIAAGIGQILAHPVTVTKIDNRRKIVSVFERGVFLKKRTELPFADVTGFDLIEEKDSEGDSFYYLTIKMKTGGKLKLSSSGMQGEEFARSLNEEVNRYFEREKYLEK